MDTSFYGFNPPTIEEWLEKIEKDLKGKSLESLNTSIDEGVQLKPLYTSRPNVANTPGQFPLSRTSQVNGSSFRNEQVFDVEEGNCNEQILEFLKNGGESVTLKGTLSETRLKKALSGVHTEMIWIGLSSSCTHEDLEVFLEAGLTSQVYFNRDENLQGPLDKSLLKRLIEHKKSYIFSINGAKIANAGGNALSELSYLVSNGYHHLNILLEAGLPIDEATSRLNFSVGLGSDYLIEISKIKALRTLWANIVDAHQPNHTCSNNCWVHGETALWNKVQQDKNNNMLRTTTEAMSGVLGGVDSLCIHTHNLSQNDKDHNQRIARNILHLVKEESHLSRVIDPLGGSYAVENLSTEMALKVWEIFKKSEQEGGFSMFWTDLKEKIMKERQQKVDDLSEGNKTLLGANQYSLDSETAFSTDQLKFNDLP